MILTCDFQEENRCIFDACFWAQKTRITRANGGRYGLSGLLPVEYRVSAGSLAGCRFVGQAGFGV